MKKSIQANFKDFTLKSPLMNASGVHCTTAKDMDELRNSGAGAFVTKTATLEPREGNPEPRYHFENGRSINSMGLPNKGLDYYLDYVNELQVKDPTSPLFLSVAQMKPADAKEIFSRIQASGYKGFTEFNASCPNVPGKPQLAYNMVDFEKQLNIALENHDGQIGIKLPPYFDGAQFDEMAELLNKYPLAYVNSINSLGNGFDIDAITGETAIHPKDGVGGIGGSPVLYTALSNVYNFRQRLKPEISIIGTGGVNSAETAIKHLRAGADLVQIATHLQENGVGIFDKINNDLEKFVQTHKLAKLQDIKGQVSVRTQIMNEIGKS